MHILFYILSFIAVVGALLKTSTVISQATIPAIVSLLIVIVCILTSRALLARRSNNAELVYKRVELHPDVLKELYASVRSMFLRPNNGAAYVYDHGQFVSPHRIEYNYNYKDVFNNHTPDLVSDRSSTASTVLDTPATRAPTPAPETVPQDQGPFNGVPTTNALGLTGMTPHAQVDEPVRIFCVVTNL